MSGMMKTALVTRALDRSASKIDKVKLQ